ncbi:MAG: transketolase [Desulfuromonadaceae bacterium]|nr:transketolase [Desulfuromonadaceae bacterium]
MPNLTEKASAIRNTILEMAHRSKSPHVGSCLSPVDIMATLYFDVMNIDPWDSRDIFILSKGHAAMAMYATLAHRGIIPMDLLEGYYQDNGTLPAHLDKFAARGVEVSAGSLGHGYNIGLGLAFGFKKQQSARKVYIIIGDGESQEGSIWEGAMFASRLGLDNVTVFIDHNNLQGYGRPTEICCYEPVREKWEAFGWHAVEIDGHDISRIKAACGEESQGKPKVVIARTTKGKGVSFMEDQLVWHYFIVTDEHLQTAKGELV